MNGVLFEESGVRERAAAALGEFAGLKGMDLASEVTTDKTYRWQQGAGRADGGYADAGEARWSVVAYDYGIKRNILRMLSDHNCRVEVVPATTPAREVIERRPDGVFLSNGPGDPEPCGYAIAAIRELLDANLPVFGICLGHQLLGLACGARTQKMKFGHHGANHPVLEIDSGRVLITSQNHGFCVEEASLPGHLRATHRSLFDGSLQGIRHTEKPAFGFQGHPEASPGPHDVSGLFGQFAALMQQEMKQGMQQGTQQARR